MTWAIVVAGRGGYILRLEPTGCDDRLDQGSKREKGLMQLPWFHTEHLDLCCPMQWPLVTFNYSN